MLQLTRVKSRVDTYSTHLVGPWLLVKVYASVVSVLPAGMGPGGASVGTIGKEHRYSQPAAKCVSRVCVHCPECCIINPHAGPDWFEHLLRDLIANPV